MNDFPIGGYAPSFLGERMQVGMIVHDLDAAMRYWSEVLGVGPWVAIENSLGDRHMYHRGERTAPNMSLALSYLGETQVELIAQHDDAATPYKEFLDQGREGVHHFAYWPEDYPGACTELTERGFDEQMTIVTPGGEKSVSYFAGPPVLGVMIEIVPFTAQRQAYYGAIEALARSWDGERPIRRFASRDEFLASADVAALRATDH